MWQKAESDSKPNAIVKDEACGIVYVNRNIKEITRRDMDDKEHTVYQFEVNKVALDDWETYEAVLNHTTEINEVQEAVMELASIMAGE